ncbi:MAG TPA: ABC transporter substrate-binding protein, partial [Thalassospira lucentensis]|nr:ABC transporter substrate-binding protein [Thalassospira lucentensis]
MIVKFKGSSAVIKGSAVAVALGLAVLANPASADQYTDAAKNWIDSEFQPSSLSKDAQMAEL